MKISVALAAYHGEKYIEAQLESILSQLPSDGELIISDDDPGGETQKIINSFAARDSRVVYLEGSGAGVTANFENALRHCSGDVIFLSDQDDVWLPGKVEAVMKEISAGAALVLHDAHVTDGELNVTEESFFAVHGSRSGFVRNLIRNSFVGCCMAFKKELLEAALPFPEKLPMHDWWLALIAMKHGLRVTLLPEPLIYWRRHGENVTGGKNSFSRQLMWRVRISAFLLRR